MTAPATIELKADLARGRFGQVEYDLTYRGVPRPEVGVVRLQDRETGAITLSIEAPKVNGKPVLNNSQMDAVARKIFEVPEVRAYAGTNGSQRLVRRYAR